MRFQIIFVLLKLSNKNLNFLIKFEILEKYNFCFI